MSALDDARRTLRDFLQDMTVLVPYSDPASAEAAVFCEAFRAARKAALEAARRYVDVLAVQSPSTSKGP